MIKVIVIDKSFHMKIKNKKNLLISKVKKSILYTNLVQSYKFLFIYWQVLLSSRYHKVPLGVNVIIKIIIKKKEEKVGIDRC